LEALMERHVIKGRGPYRGKYLCWARMAPNLTPTEDGFVWLPEQRKAVRWDDPRYHGGTWATDRARLNNGYFVKLVAPAPDGFHQSWIHHFCPLDATEQRAVGESASIE